MRYYTVRFQSATIPISEEMLTELGLKPDQEIRDIRLAQELLLCADCYIEMRHVLARVRKEVMKCKQHKLPRYLTWLKKVQKKAASRGR
jgi:hypothetical protein